MAGSTRRLREDVAALTKTIAALRAEVAELRAAQTGRCGHCVTHSLYPSPGTVRIASPAWTVSWPGTSTRI